MRSLLGSGGDELRGLGRFLERDGRRLAARDGGGDRVEIAGADLALVAGRGVAGGLAGELALLQLGIGRHAAVAVAARQLEHPVVEAVEAGQGHELELVAHGAELALELGDGRVVELGLPVEGRRAIVGEQLAGMLFLDRLGEASGLVEIGMGGLQPEEVGDRRRRGRARCNGRGPCLPSGGRSLPACGRPVDEWLVALVDVGGDQLGALRVGAGDEDRRHAQTSAASRAASRLRICAWVGISTLPPRWPHFFSDASWSSKWTPAAPASI